MVVAPASGGQGFELEVAEEFQDIGITLADVAGVMEAEKIIEWLDTYKKSA